MNYTRKKAWDKFELYAQEARKKHGDLFVPVALVLLPATNAAEGELDVHADRETMSLWPSSVPIEMRGPLLRRVADSYDDRTVKRETHTLKKDSGNG